MNKYRKKPVIIEAIEWTGYNFTDTEKFITVSYNVNLEEKTITISTLEGDIRANVGDYIIKGVKGEFYPCKPDIFEATYELVE